MKFLKSKLPRIVSKFCFYICYKQILFQIRKMLIRKLVVESINIILQPFNIWKLKTINVLLAEEVYILQQKVIIRLSNYYIGIVWKKFKAFLIFRKYIEIFFAEVFETVRYWIRVPVLCFVRHLYRKKCMHKKYAGIKFHKYVRSSLRQSSDHFLRTLSRKHKI